MSLTNESIAAMPDLSDQSLLKLTRIAIAEVMAGGQSMQLNGKMLTRADLPKLWDSVKQLEARIAAAAGSADAAFDGTALIQFN